MVQLQALVGYLRWPVSIAGGLSALILALLYAFQGKIIYVPRIPGVPGGYVARPEEYNLDHEDVWLRTADGVRLHAWVVFRKGLKAEEACTGLEGFMATCVNKMLAHVQGLKKPESEPDYGALRAYVEAAWKAGGFAPKAISKADLDY